MIENNSGNVSSAFEMLLEEIETEKDVDHKPLASDPDMPRWRNFAQWARHTMRQEGLLKDDSPHGTWEITDAGRARLAEDQQA
ncbi:MAG: winged helix-turn-helix domain-containing protein [Kiritimatiellae bacterium]|nr:winged helix-turn-helix domain-containing protein [Kiritimatiellia bacterium]MCO5061346.1 winged helix-turn-helix domain-containing protein [Kiritimatiellia bacterium]MCO6400403.1 winged helix-turn-helix domain-containing protein [Verrucomicrobiota bacterium]